MKFVIVLILLNFAFIFSFGTTERLVETERELASDYEITQDLLK